MNFGAWQMVFSISCDLYTWRTRLNFYVVALAEYISGPSSVHTMDLPRRFTYNTVVCKYA